MDENAAEQGPPDPPAPPAVGELLQAGAQGRMVRIAIVLIAVVVIIAGLRQSAQVLLPILISIFLVVIFQPLTGAMINRGVPRAVAVIVTILLLGVMLFGAGAYLGEAVSRFTARIPEYQQPLVERFQGTVAWLESRGVPLERLSVGGSIDGSAVADSVRTLLGALVSLISKLVIVLIITSFALLESTSLENKLLAAFGDQVAERVALSVGSVQRYLGLKTVMSLATGLLAGLLCWSVGIDFPVVWGFLAFVLNYIPNVGSALAAIPPVLLSLVQVDWRLTVLLVVGYVAINVGVGSVVEPRIMGRRLGLSPLVVFVSLVFWGFVWGPVGMLISVPLTVVCKLFMEQNDQTRWLAILLGPGSEVRAVVSQRTALEETAPAD